MSSGSKQLTRYGVESSVGTVATAWQTLAFTTNGLNETPTTTESQSIKDSRIAAGTLVTGSDIAGDLETEFAYGIQDTLLECVAFNPWVANVLTFGGTTRKTLSIVKAYTDINNWHTFTGCHVNTWALSIATDEIVTSTFGIIGLARTASGTAPAGTVTPAPSAMPFTAISAGDIQFDDVAIAGTMCVTALDITFDNTAQVQKCINYEDSIGAVLETILNATGTMTIAWSVGAAAEYEKQFTNTPVKVNWTLKNANGDQYIFELPEVLLSMELPTGASGDILTVDASFSVRDVAPTITRVPFVGP